MLKSLIFVSLLASAVAATAQSVDPPAPEQSPAPIVRSSPSNSASLANQSPENDPNGPTGQPPYPGRAPMPRRIRRSGLNSPDTRAPQILDSQPIAGVWLRSTSDTSYTTVSATPQGTEVRLDRGILNVNVHQPAPHTAIFVDLPGGQVSLLKDGLYTFNAGTNTLRVLRGEAAAFVGPATSTGEEKHIKVKEDHQLAFSPAPASSAAMTSPATTASGMPSPVPAPVGFQPKSVEAYPYELAADLLPANSSDGNAYANVSGPGYGYLAGDDGPYGYPFYGYGFGYPYSGYPYSVYPHGGYPYVGVGFGYGYYGGFHGYRGGFHGGGRSFRR